MKSKLILLTFILSILTSCGIQINEGFVDAISDSTPTSTTSTLSVDQTDDDNTTSGFGGGSHTGTTYSIGVLTLNTTTNNAELDESWTPLWSNLTNYWKLDESSWNGTANEVIDSIGTDHGVRMGGADTSTNSKIGQYAGDFDGNGDYIYISKSQNQSIRNESVSLWFRSEGASSASSGNTSAFVVMGNVTANPQFSIELDGATQTTIRCRGDHSPSDLSTSYVTINLNDWYHAVCTSNYSGGNLTLSLYLNSILVTSNTAAVTSYGESSTRMKIGCEKIFFNRSFNGKIDDVAKWNAVLTSDDVALIYSRQSAKYAGEMKSRTIDSEDINSSWTNLDWVTILPFGKELTGSTGSENSSDYSSLVGSTGSTNDNDLMNGIIGLWHFNEALWNGTSGEVIDSSGNNNHGTADTVTVSDFGYFQKSGKMSAGFVNINTIAGELDTAVGSVSTWVYRTFSDTASDYRPVFHFGLNNDNRIYFSYVDGSNVWRFHHEGSNVDKSINLAASSIPRNTWTHVAMTWDSSSIDEVRGYINGNLVGTRTSLGSFASSPSVYRVGQSDSSARRFQGYIDEFAVWNRVLHADEILQLYRRGTNRIKYQVRTCTSSDCSDQDALTGDGWKGPGGNYLTYFSELYNNSSITATCTTAQECYSSELSLQGNVGATSPSIYFNSFGTDGLLGVDNNRYFQYRVIMESDDENTACDSGTATCMPELKSVTIGPGHTYEE